MAVEPALKLRVSTDGDAVLEERLLRSLLADLGEVEGVDARMTADTAPTSSGAKAGSALGDAVLWVSLGAAAGKTTADVLLASIRAWSAKQHDRIVRIRTEDGSEYEIPPDVDETQQQLVERILGNERS